MYCTDLLTVKMTDAGGTLKSDLVVNSVTVLK